MLFFKLVEVVLLVVIAVFCVSQIILPAYKNRLMFPLFRKQGKLEKKEAELNQLKVEEALRYKLDKMKGEK